MPKTTLRITGEITGMLSGRDEIGPADIVNPNGSGKRLVKALANGNNDLTAEIPTNCIGVLIFPPAGNTVDIRTAGVAGDTGHLLHRTVPSFVTIGTGGTLFLKTTGTVTVELLFA